MSETDTDAPSLEEQARQALDIGDYQAAQRLHREAMEKAEPEQDGTLASHLDEPEEASDFDGPEPPAPATTSATPEELAAVVENLRAAGVPDEDIEALDAEWGTSAAQNYGYARAFAAELAETAPELDQIVNSEMERNPAIVPSILRLAARLGREARHGGVSAVEALQKETGMSNSDMAEGAAEMERLTEEAHRAMQRGRGAEAQKLFSQREKLARRLYGDGPAIGHEGRTA